MERRRGLWEEMGLGEKEGLLRRPGPGGKWGGRQGVSEKYSEFRPLGCSFPEAGWQAPPAPGDADLLLPLFPAGSWPLAESCCPTFAQRLGRQSDRQLLCLFNILQARPIPTHPLPLPPTLRGEARVPPLLAQGLRHQMAAAAWPGHRTETRRQRTHYCRQAGRA